MFFKISREISDAIFIFLILLFTKSIEILNHRIPKLSQKLDNNLTLFKNKYFSGL